MRCFLALLALLVQVVLASQHYFATDKYDVTCKYDGVADLTGPGSDLYYVCEFGSKPEDLQDYGFYISQSEEDPVEILKNAFESFVSEDS